jgi:hypothetical protein
MKFCTTINCMDGRVQLPVINFLQKRFNAEYVDSITDPGPNLILAEQTDKNAISSIIKRLEISVNHHHSEAIAITGHYGCAGNPSTKDEQFEHTVKSVNYLKETYPNLTIIGLWIDDNWQVSEVT